MSSLGKIWRAAWDGWNNRCPECRQGHIWDKTGAIHKQCERCGLLFEPDEVDWGGFSWAYMLEGLIPTAATLVVGLVLELFWDVPWTTHAYLWVAFLIVTHLLYYKNAKGQWVGIRSALMGRPESRI